MDKFSMLPPFAIIALKSPYLRGQARATTQPATSLCLDPWQWEQERHLAAVAGRAALALAGGTHRCILLVAVRAARFACGQPAGGRAQQAVISSYAHQSRPYPLERRGPAGPVSHASLT